MPPQVAPHAAPHAAVRPLPPTTKAAGQASAPRPSPQGQRPVAQRPVVQQPSRQPSPQARVPQRSAQPSSSSARPTRTGSAPPVTEPLAVEGTTRFGTMFPNLSASIGQIEEELDKIRREREAAATAPQPAAPQPAAPRAKMQY
jgi:hypothetical protein